MSTHSLTRSTYAFIVFAIPGGRGRYAERERFRNLTKHTTGARRVRLRATAAAVAANISSACCTAGDRARSKGRVTKTTYIFSTQFQTLKGKRDLLGWSCINYTFHKHDVRGGRRGRGGPPSFVYARRVSRGEGGRRGLAEMIRMYVRRGSEAYVLLNYSRVTASLGRDGGGGGAPPFAKLCA